MLITTENVGFGYDDKRILENVSFTVNEGERIGLIGGNGEGKTTLLKLLTRDLLPDEGRILTKSNLKIGYLEQNGGFDSDKTVFEEMRSVFSRVFSAIGELRSLEHEMAKTPFGSREYAAIAARYERLNKLIAAEDGYNAEVKIRTVLGGMGFEKMRDQVINTMSGGEKTRLKLCRLLLEQPEILFLDEPTNHFDVSTLFWLEEYLQDYRGAVFTVSHDRYFLDKTVKKIFELENNRLTTFRGNYSKYKILKAEKYEYELKEYERQQEEIASLKEYIDKNIVRATTAKSAQSRVKKLENMTMLERPLPPPKPPVFSFTFGERSEELSLSVNGLTLEAGGKRLFTDAAFEVRRGEKFAVVGENGTGKSTLIRELLKKTHPAVKWGRFVKIGYYDQENANLDGEDTVLGALWFKHTALSQTQARNLLARAKLSEEDVDKKVKSLSGGERAKLSLVLLQAENANFLILDEPTNHLDLAARESLEAALRAFEGTLLFVSHDRYFIQNLADHVLEIENGRVTAFKGSYDEFNTRKKAQASRAEEAAAAAKKTAQTPSYRSKADRAEDARKKARLKEVEISISRTEEEIAALNGEIARPEVASNYKLLTEKCARLDELHALCDGLYKEYETLL